MPVHIVPAGLNGKIIDEVDPESKKFKEMAREYKEKYHVDYEEGRNLSHPQYIVKINSEKRKELVSEDELMHRRRNTITDGLVF